MTPKTVLWIYIVLLLAGGLMGLIKGKSKISLVVSTLFAAALALNALGFLGKPVVADIVLLVLVLFFGFRLLKSKKMMPSGMMFILTAITLGLRHIV